MKVLMISPGGLEHGGGIGRMIGYMLDAWSLRSDAPHFTVVDTRGPGRLDLALVYFVRSLATIVASRLKGRSILHVHLAGRGSTLRKIIIVHLAVYFTSQWSFTCTTTTTKPLSTAFLDGASPP